MTKKVLYVAILGASFSLYAKAPVPKAAAPKPHDKVDDDTKIVMKAVSERYKQLKNWEADFVQESQSLALGTATANEGKVTFVYPDRFRFTLNKTEHSDFISNGSNAWYIQYPKGRAAPAFVKHFTDLSKIELDRYLVFLRGFEIPLKKASQKNKAKTANEDFELKGKVEGEKLVLDLVPKESSEISKISLEFVRGSPQPQLVKIEDVVGNTTQLRMTGYRAVLNPLDPAVQRLFRPDFPKDSKVETF